MTICEKLLQEFGCAIYAVLGDVAHKEFEDDTQISSEDLIAIAKKVKFYLDD